MNNRRYSEIETLLNKTDYRLTDLMNRTERQYSLDLLEALKDLCSCVSRLASEQHSHAYNGHRDKEY